MSTDRRPNYVGYIARDPATNKIVGSIREIVTGWSIDLELIKREGMSGYEVKGFLGEIPDKKRAKT